MTRALIVLVLFLSAGEITGLLDAVLSADCSVTCGAGDSDEGDAGCALCPCCHQGRLFMSVPRVALGDLTGIVRLGAPQVADPGSGAAAGIFHPPKASGG